MSEIRRRNWTQLSNEDKTKIDNIITLAEKLELLIEEALDYKWTSRSIDDHTGIVKIQKGPEMQLERQQSILKLRECVMWAVNGITKPEE